MAQQQVGTAEGQAEKLLAQCHGLSQRVATTVKRITAETDAVSVEVKSLQAAVKAGQKEAAALPAGEGRAAALQRLHECRAVLHGLGPGGDLRRFTNPRPPLLLRLLLGSKTNVVALRREAAMGLKEEYHAFRNTAAAIMLAAPAALLWGMRHGLRDDGQQPLPTLVAAGVQAYLAWLVYMYTALAVRENVLWLNGSAIRSWWIQHHYASAATCTILLTLPLSSPDFIRFCDRFLMFSCFQAAVMFFQNRYQRRRMYTRIALGKNSAMDVVSGESSGTSGQLRLLYPMLFGLQIWQFLLGADVMHQAYGAVFYPEQWLAVAAPDADLRAARGIFLAGCLFAAMAVMNMVNTTATIREKSSYRRRAKAKAA